MAHVAACPKCSCQLTLPGNLPPNARLRCPDCDEIFAPGAAPPVKTARAVVVVPPPSQSADTPPPADPEPAAAQPSQSPAEAPKEPPARAEAPAKPTSVQAEVPAPERERPSEKLDGLQMLLKSTMEFNSQPKVEPPKPSSVEQPPTLSDWLKRGSGEADDTPPAAEAPEEDAKPSEPLAAEQPEADKPIGAKTVSQSSAATQPSLESLLSSFRGEDPPAQEPSPPTEPQAADQSSDLDPPPAADTAQVEEDAPSPAPEPPAAAPPVSRTPPVEPTPTPPAPSQPAPTKFEDLPVESLAAPTPAAEAPPAPKGRDLRTPGMDTNPAPPRRSSRVRSLSVIVTSGALGVMLGYLGLLWLAGPSSDVLGVSNVLPSALLPASFSPDVRPPLVPPPEDPPLPEGADAESPRVDPRVEQAGFADEGGQHDAAVAAFSEPDPAPAALSQGGVRLIGAPAPYTIDQLSEVLRGADDARAVMCDKSLAANPEAARELGSAYGKLCQVAQVLTFVEDASADRELTTLEAKELYIRLFTFDHARSDSRAMASRWLAWPERANGGVFFSGALKGAKPMGSVSELRVTLSDGEVVSVLTDEQLDPARFFGGTEIGVVGCVVEDPVNRVEGYKGVAERAVWACHTFPVGKPRHD